MIKRYLCLTMAIIMAFTLSTSFIWADTTGTDAVKVYSTKKVPSKPGAWSEWSKVKPSSDLYDQVQSKTVYRYKDKIYTYSTEDELEGYDFEYRKDIVKKDLSDWEKEKGKSSRKIVDNGVYKPYIKEIDYETKSVHYSFIYHCACNRWFWVNTGGVHENSCPLARDFDNEQWAHTTELLEVYTEEDITQILPCDNDGVDKPGYWCGIVDFNDREYSSNTIFTGEDEKLGKVYAIYDDGNKVDSYTSDSPNDNFYLFSEKIADTEEGLIQTQKHNIFKKYVECYRNVFSKPGTWSSYSFTKPAEKEGRTIQKLTVYRCRDVDFVSYQPKLSLSKASSTAIKLEWSQLKYADGYKIYMYDYSKKKYRLVATKSAAVKSTTHKELKRGKTYKYRVRGYRMKNGVVQYTRYSYARSLKL